MCAGDTPIDVGSDQGSATDMGDISSPALSHQCQWWWQIC